MNIWALFRAVSIYGAIYVGECNVYQGIKVHQLHQLYGVNFAILVNLVVLVNIMGLGA